MRSFKIKEIREIQVCERINLFNLFKKELFSNTHLTVKEIKQTKDLTDSIFTEIEKNIFLPYFFEYPTYTNTLKAEIQKTMLGTFSMLPNVVLKRNDLIEKIIDLSKSIYLKSVKNEYIIDIIEVPTLKQYAMINKHREARNSNNAQNAVDDVYNSAKMHAGSILINQR